MGTVVSKRRISEVSESTAVKIRVVAAFQGDCKDNSYDKEGQQSSCSATESTTATVDHNKTTQLKPSVANTKFPRGVYPQRESNLSLPGSTDDAHHDDNHIQPYRLKLGVLTSSGTQLSSNLSCNEAGKIEETSHSSAVVQLRPGGDDHLGAKQQEAGKVPDELDWLLKKGVTPPEMHTAATVIQRNVRGYQCRKKLVKEVSSAALIQRSFRQWRKRSSSMLLAQRKDEQIFIPSNSIAAVDDATVLDDATAIDDATAMDNDTTLDTIAAVVDKATALHTMQLEGEGSHVQQLHKSKPLASINEDTVNDISVTDDDALRTHRGTSLTVDTASDNESSKRTNSDIAVALKEILNMEVPDFTDVRIPSSVRERKYSDLEILGERTREHLNTLYRSTLLNSARNKAFKIGVEQFKMYLEFQNEIDETMFLAQQKAELALGESYVPCKILLISSRVPKVTLLQCAILPDVITFVYDFERATYYELINKIANALDEYKQGAKIKNLGIICKGGPGYLYLFANKPVTPVKLFKDHKMMTFWKVLGAMMSKLVPEETVIHFMESNVNGNKQGEQLLKDLEKLMYPSKVNVTCPLEIGRSGQQMISTYFHSPKYRMWKQKRYTKLKLY